MTTIDEILEQEERLANAKRTLDLDAIDRLYTDDLLLTSVLGEPTCTKTAVMDEMRRGLAQRDAAKAAGTQIDAHRERGYEGRGIGGHGRRQLPVRRDVQGAESGPPPPIPDDERLGEARRSLADRRGAHGLRARSAAGGYGLRGARGPMTGRRHFLATIAGAALGSSRLIASCHASVADTRAAPAVRRWAAVRKLLNGYVAGKKMAGAIVAVSYGDAAPAYLAAGTIALDSSARFDEHSVCRIYSMTKPVTGIAATLLVEDGTIRLDQPVADVLPEFREVKVAIDIEKSLDSRPATKTMRHLLTHTSGLASWTPLSSGPALLHVAYRERGITPGNAGERLNRPGYGPQARSLVEMVERLAALPLAYEPGTVYKYSIGTDVMAPVIERASGKKYEAFLHDRLFAPLGMVSTGFQVRPQDAARLTTNYEVAPNGLTPTDPAATSVFLRPPLLIAGGGGLVSTARDYSRFGAALLDDGALEGTRVMKVETARK